MPGVAAATLSFDFEETLQDAVMMITAIKPENLDSRISVNKQRSKKYFLGIKSYLTMAAETVSFARLGIMIRKMVPTPWVDTTEISPPMRESASFTMYKPMPKPFT